MDALRHRAQQVAIGTGYGNLTQKEINEIAEGIVNCSKIIQACDSGAYTTFATTQDKKDPRVFYHNGNPGFERAFKQIGNTHVLKE